MQPVTYNLPCVPAHWEHTHYGDAINLSELWDSLNFSPHLSRTSDLLTWGLREETNVNPFLKY